MAVLMPRQASVLPPYKRMRRTATSVLAGDFDMRPGRDVLTSLLNGVEPYKVVEKEEETRRARRRERKERDKEKKKAKTASSWEKLSAEPRPSASASAVASIPKSAPPVVQASSSTTSAFWRARPAIHIATMQRSVSVTPPPMPSSPASTPGPSVSSSTSRTSSKRPRTPDDDEDLNGRHVVPEPPSPPPPPPPRKKRVAVRKGWKGWVEGSPQPSEKLINLDVVPVLHERRTRSGKNFDAISTGKDDWV